MTRITPVEHRAGRYYKRDDLYRHPSGVNGGKWRQCRWLIDRAAEAGAPGIVTGASVLSPQLPMVAIAAAHRGLPVIEVIGSVPETAARLNPGVRIAAEYGATFHPITVGYNPAIQRTVAHLAEETGYHVLHYGIAPPPGADKETQAAFYDLGAEQAAALPPTIRTLVIPFGSGNSAISILYGLDRAAPKRLETVVLVGIGPSKWNYLVDRLVGLGVVPGIAYDLKYHDLHGSGEVAYGQRVPYTSDGIDLHPTYEGKVARWLDRSGLVPGWTARDRSTCLWIVGSAVAP